MKRHFTHLKFNFKWINSTLAPPISQSMVQIEQKCNFAFGSTHRQPTYYKQSWFIVPKITNDGNQQLPLISSIRILPIVSWFSYQSSKSLSNKLIAKRLLCCIKAKNLMKTWMPDGMVLHVCKITTLKIPIKYEETNVFDIKCDDSNKRKWR